MSNTLIPFNFNPTNVFPKGTDVYTVPTNKFARVLLVSKLAADYGELYIKRSAGSAAYLNSTITQNSLFGTWPIAQGTHTLLSIASGYKYLNTRIVAAISSSNGAAIFAWTGSSPAAGTIITIPQNSSNDTGAIAVEYTGPGNFTLQNVGAGNTNYSSGSITGYLYRTGEVLTTTPDSAVNPASIAGEVWLAAGDEISFEGGLIVNEYDQPS